MFIEKIGKRYELACKHYEEDISNGLNQRTSFWLGKIFVYQEVLKELKSSEAKVKVGWYRFYEDVDYRPVFKVYLGGTLVYISYEFEKIKNYLKKLDKYDWL